MSEHNLILEFYKPTYNLDFDYDGNGGLDLHFTNIKGEFFMTMNDSYNSVYIEDEDCEFSKGEMFATVDLGDLVERIINGEFRQTNGKAINDWSKRFIGDDEEQIEFNGKNYADGSLFWDDFFKEMSKDEIKDFMTFCEDYLDLPNIEVDTVSDKYDFENGEVELKSNGKWGITVNDDYTIISVDKFTCNSTDACDAYDVASSELDEDDYYESKKSVKRSLKEEKVTDSLFQNVVFSMIKKFKLKKEYDVERPSWSVFNFRHKNKDAQFAITFDERGHGDFLYGEVLAFGDEKDDIFKYKTDEVKVDSYNIEKECSNIIADCLAFIDANKKITIFESKKSARKNLKEGISAFNKAIAKKYNETEPNSAGQYYLDWRFDLQDEKDNIEAIADRCGVTVEFQSDEGYFEVFEESKKSARKSMKESKVDFQSVIDKVIPKEYAKNKNAYKYALSCVESLYNEDEYNSDSAKVYFLNCYISDLFPSWVDELGKEEIDAFANALYDGTMKWSDIDSSWFESKKSARNSLKKYLVKGLDVDFVVDHLLSLEDPNNFDLINKLDDLWEVYNKSWSKFNKSLSDFWKVMKNIKKLDSFDKTCKEIIDAWYDDIEKIFYSDDNLENLKLNYGFEGNDVF